jgi:TPR repeat protein
MRQLILALVLGAALPAFASDLAQANRLLEAKSYSQAIALLDKLAAQGDSGAQLRLGQVYWYGEGVKADRARGDALFARASAAGNKDAAEAMTLSARRGQHDGDIGYWTRTYDGTDLRAASDACKRPVIPAKSTTNKEIKATQDEVAAWKGCHNDFVARMQAALPVGKSIPPDVLDLMSDEEVEQAKVHLSAIYKRLTEETASGASQTLAAYDAWEKTTVDFVKTENELREARLRQFKADEERRRAEFMHRDRIAPPAPMPQPQPSTGGR